jgi:hypothetical protein
MPYLGRRSTAKYIRKVRHGWLQEPFASCRPCVTQRLPPSLSPQLSNFTSGWGPDYYLRQYHMLLYFPYSIQHAFSYCVQQISSSQVIDHSTQCMVFLLTFILHLNVVPKSHVSYLACTFPSSNYPTPKTTYISM